MTCTNTPIPLDLIGTPIQGPSGNYIGSHVLLIYPTRVAAVKDAPSLKSGQRVEIESDADHKGRRTRNTISGGSVVFTGIAGVELAGASSLPASSAWVGVPQVAESSDAQRAASNAQAQALADRTEYLRSSARISTSQFQHLVFEHTAKDQGDPASHVASKFFSWRLAIQAAIDAANAAGGGTVLVNGGNAPYAGATLLVDDEIIVKSGVRLEFDATIKLGDYTSRGGLLIHEGDNIEVINPRLDGSGIFAGGSGENGICPISGDQQTVRGGVISNFSRGNAGGKFGGKAFQVEGGPATNVNVSGVTIKNSFIAMSASMDFSETQLAGPILFSEMIIEDCEILMLVRQSSGIDLTALKHSVSLNGFTAKRVGSHEGVFQLSRAVNVSVANGLISNSASVDSLIRGNCLNSEFLNLTYVGDATQLINLDPSEYAPDNSFPPSGNTYDLKHVGTTGFVANSGPTTPNRFLQNCDLKFMLSEDVTSKIVGDELRNGYCRIQGQQGNRSLEATSQILYLKNLPKFANLASGHTEFSNTIEENNLTSPITLTDSEGGYTVGYINYEKIGRRVHVSFRIAYPAGAVGTNAVVAGLPFPATDVGGRVSSGSAISFTDVGSLLTARVIPGENVIRVYTLSGAPATIASISGKYLDGTINYIAD